MGVSISTGRLVAFGLTKLNTPNDLSHPCEASVSHLLPFGLNFEQHEGPNFTTKRFFLNTYVALLGSLNPSSRWSSQSTTGYKTQPLRMCCPSGPIFTYGPSHRDHPNCSATGPKRPPWSNTPTLEPSGLHRKNRRTAG